MMNKRKQKFTPEEDQLILSVVAQRETLNWKQIAQNIPGRTSLQVRERYMNYLAPNVSLLPWTNEETQLLFYLVDKLGQKWSQISKFFSNRSSVSVKNQWVVIKRKLEKYSLQNCQCIYYGNIKPTDQMKKEVLPQELNIETAEFDFDMFEELDLNYEEGSLIDMCEAYP